MGQTHWRNRSSQRPALLEVYVSGVEGDLYLNSLKVPRCKALLLPHHISNIWGCSWEWKLDGHLHPVKKWISSAKCGTKIYHLKWIATGSSKKQVDSMQESWPLTVHFGQCISLVLFPFPIVRGLRSLKSQLVICLRIMVDLQLCSHFQDQPKVYFTHWTPTPSLPLQITPKPVLTSFSHGKATGRYRPYKYCL